MVSIGEEVIEEVDNFKYLGKTLSFEGERIEREKKSSVEFLLEIENLTQK